MQETQKTNRPRVLSGRSRLIVLMVLSSIFVFPLIAGRAADTGIFNVLDFGARGDGTNNDTVAIQKAIDTCAAQGGGQVLLPPGKTFLTGALTLHSGIDFHLANGAVLKGSANWRDYGHPGALLFAKDATNITVSGNGVIDGNDRAVWQELANEEAGGDVNKAGWWPESFTGDWWPFDKLPESTANARRPANDDDLHRLPAGPLARLYFAQRPELDGASDRLRRRGH